ncbi:MAG: OmpH family outer membrane protein [Alphaproteobacteria bacterium]
MNSFKFAFAAVSATALMALTGNALAQAPARPATAAAAAATRAAAPAAPAATAISHGPAIAGVCIVDIDQILAESAIGKAANTRLQKLQTDVQAEVTAEQTSLVNDAKTFQAQRATLAQDAADKKDADLQVRNNALQRKVQQRQAELQATQQKAADRILSEIDPVEAQVYQQRNCSVLLSRQSVIAANPAMDITPVVITALNARISMLTFERERLDQPVAAPQTR